MDNLNKFKSSEELKAFAKEHLFGKYGITIGACVVVNLITLFVSYYSTIFLNTKTIYGIILNFVISFVISVLTGLFTSGEKYFYLKIVCGKPVTLSDVFYGFKLYPNKAVLIQLYLSIWIYISMIPQTVLTYLLLLYPGNATLTLLYNLAMILYLVVSIMIFLIYSQAFYLLHDFPEYSVSKLLSTSRKLMKGSKGRLFYLTVSFLPLLLLGLLSCGIACLWIAPYINTTYTEFFLDLMKTNQVSD